MEGTRTHNARRTQAPTQTDMTETSGRRTPSKVTWLARLSRTPPTDFELPTGHTSSSISSLACMTVLPVEAIASRRIQPRNERSCSSGRRALRGAAGKVSVFFSLGRAALSAKEIRGGRTRT